VRPQVAGRAVADVVREVQTALRRRSTSRA
jgi:hypothetical protein